MGRSRDIADMLSKTELANTNNERLIIEDTVGVDSAYVSANTLPPLAFYSTLDSLPVTGLTVGQQAYVDSNNRLYISDGSGWYNKAFITLTPTITLDPSGTIVLSNDGVTTSTVTVVAVDSDTPGSGLTYSVDSDGNGIGKYVISQDSSVFTIRPLSEDSGATAGTFTLTFSTTDGDNIATDSSEFSLTFSTVVDSSAPTVLLMKATGSGADNADIDYQYGSNFSTQSLTFTSAGTPQATTFNPYRSGGYSAYFDGSGDYLTTGTSTDFAFGTGDFTWEMWIYHTAYEPAYLLEFGTGGDLGIHHATAQGHLVYYTSTTGIGSSLYTTGFGSMSAGNWYHIAAVRQSGTTYLYTDGVLQTSASDTTNYGSSAISCRIGAYGNGGSFPFTGYVRDVRIIKGTAQYTSAFTPPTEPLTTIANTSLLACHLPYIGDGSSSGHSITVNGDTKTMPFGPYDYNPTYTANQSAYGDAHSYAGSTYFDGTGDYLQVSNSSSYAFGTGDFTVEAWVNYSTFSGSGGQAIVSNGTSISSGTTGHWYLTAYGASDLRFGRHGSAQYTSVTSILVVNAWNHIAVTRSGSTVRIFVNGVSLTTSNTGGGIGSYDFNNSSGYLFIGEGASFSAANGYISDVRIIKGSAQYTSDFTPPTTPNTWVTNTTLLAQTVYGPRVYDAAAANGLTLIGNTQSSTTRRKFTTSSSVYFDGSGDYIRQDEVLDVFTSTSSPFTFEGWINFNTTGGGYRHIVGGNAADNGFNTFLFGHNSTAWKVYYNNTERTPTGTISTNTWYHFAVSYDGSTSRTFINGTLAHTESSVTLDDALSDCVFLIGSEADAANAGSLGNFGNFYLQDLRVSSVARYTAAFTPPTAEFEL